MDPFPTPVSGPSYFPHMYPRTSLNVLAGVFIAAGVILMLEHLGLISGVSRLWPLLPMAVGGGFLLLFAERGKSDTVLVWLGVFLLCNGPFFLYLNYARWGLMATLWPIFLGIVAASFFAVSFFSPRHVFSYLSLLFFTLFVALLLVFGVSTRLWPIALIIFGLSLLVVNYAGTRRTTQTKEDPSG